MYRTILLLLVILFAACHEVFEPDVNSGEDFLVVEGTIGSKAGWYFVYLRMSNGLNERTYFRGVNNAIVWVESNNGDKYSYTEVRTGSYAVKLDRENSIKIGHTYTLHVVTATGDSYVSSPQKVSFSPPITNLYCNHQKDIVLTEDTYGFPEEEMLDGIEIYFDTKGNTDSTNYFRYSQLGYEQHRNVYSSTMFGLTTYRHRGLKGLYSSILCTTNGENYPDSWIRNKSYFFIDKQVMNDFTPDTIPGYDLAGTYFEGLIFRLRQYSLSPDAFRYYNDIEKQLASEGRLFDPANPQVQGNIVCVNDSNKLVLGVFSASHISERFAFFYINYKNRTFTKQLDAFPKLYINNATGSRPNDWIDVPF